MGESLLPFIPERQTAVLLAFRNALLNTAARNYNITGYSTVPNQAGSADVLRISMKIEVSRVSSAWPPLPLVCPQTHNPAGLCPFTRTPGVYANSNQTNRHYSWQNLFRDSETPSYVE